jgi:hypothetical protein
MLHLSEKSETRFTFTSEYVHTWFSSCTKQH